MSYTPFTAVCEMGETSNGLTRALFTADADMSDPSTYPEYVLVNLDKKRGPYKEGSLYWVHIYPAQPREIEERV